MKLVNTYDIEPLEPGRFVIGQRLRKGVPESWYLRKMVPLNQRTNRRNPYVFTSLKANSKEEAVLQVKALRAGGQAGRAPSAKQSRMKVRALSKGWLDGLDSTKRHRVRRFKTTFKNHILPSFGDLYLHELERTAIHRWAEKRVRAGTKESTFKIDVHALRTFLNWCDREFDSHSIDVMPSDWRHLSFQLPAISAKFSKSVADELINFAYHQALACSHPNHPRYWTSARLYGAIAFLRFTGIRVQEFGKLRFQDITIKKTTVEQRRGFVLRNMLPAAASEELIEDAVNSEEAAYWAGFSIHVHAVKHKSHERIVIPRVEFFDDWLGYLDLYRQRCLGQNLKILYTGSIEGIPGANCIFPNTPADLKVGGLSISRPHSTLLNNFAKHRSIEFKNLNQQCWRHTYATEIIEHWINSGLSPDVQMLARNMGTSETMLRRHYEKELDVLVPQSLSM